LNGSEPRTDPEASVKYPVLNAWTLEAGKHKDSGKPILSGALKAEKLMIREDALAQMGRLKRAIVSRYAKPMGYGHRCSYDLTLEPGGEEPAVALKGEDAECWQSFVK
jgi:hypothetical protein